ncbi:MAG: phosphonopyruvate decarboxylase, partial [Ruminococcus sp.]|nr:phosphonopyruvate decarboxylase [Ruminococcus sp.]
VHDEPQHIYQGEVTVKLMEDMDVETFIIGKDTADSEVENAMKEFKNILAKGKCVAFIVRKGALSYDEKVVYKNNNTMVREEIIRHITAVSGDDPIVSTTGKASRELFEIREANSQPHKFDFLTVGSMGHSSSIALGIAINKPNTKIWCIDGDGAVLMHMGAMAVMGANKPENLVHVVINNSAHETVGGMPTVAGNIDITGIAKACGYPYAVSVDSFEALDNELKSAKERNSLSLIEVKCSIGARDDLGRPTTTALENKQNFMEYLKNLG